MGFRTSATETRHIPARATGNQWIEGFPAPIYLLIGLYFHTLRKDTRGGLQSRYKTLIYKAQTLPRAEFSDKPPLPVV